jgi:beta-glucanase (GH16 family)
MYTFNNRIIMNKNLVIPMLQLFCTLICITMPATAQEWQLVWSDEFNGSGLPDRAKWNYEVGYVRNNEKQYYTYARSANSRMENGNLVIEGRKEQYESMDYTSASLTTRESASWTYGKIEARMQLPGGRGTWPAFWTLGTDIDRYGWPYCGEIDIMENVGYQGERAYGNIHTTAYNHSIGTGKGHWINVPGLYSSFRVYGIEWTNQRISFYIDDSVHFHFDNEGTGNAAWPFNKPHYLLVNLAIGGSWGGTEGIDTTIFPVKMLVDYIRVYQRKQPPPYHLNVVTDGAGTVAVAPQQQTYADGASVTLTSNAATGFQFTGWSGSVTSLQNPLTVTMDRHMDLVAHFTRPGEMVNNGTFTRDTQRWFLWCNTGASAKDTTIDGAYRITATDQGVYDWEILFSQSGIPFESNKKYILRFDTWSQQPTSFTTRIVKAQEPYTEYYRKTVAVTADKQHIELIIDMGTSSEPNGRIEFDFGLSAGAVYLDNVSCVPEGFTGTERPGAAAPSYVPFRKPVARVFHDMPLGSTEGTIYSLFGRKIRTTRTGSASENRNGPGVYIVR